MRPTHPNVSVSEEPPALTSGKGIPVIGIRPVTAAMFIRACMTIMAVRPPAIRRPRWSLQLSAMRMPAQANSANAARMESEPNSPSSSPITAKMKSV